MCPQVCEIHGIISDVVKHSLQNQWHWEYEHYSNHIDYLPDHDVLHLLPVYNVHSSRNSSIPHPILMRVFGAWTALRTVSPLCPSMTYAIVELGHLCLGQIDSLTHLPPPPPPPWTKWQPFHRWRFKMRFLEWIFLYWKTIWQLFYAASRFVHYFVTICELKLELQTGNAQFRSQWSIFLARVTLKFEGWPRRK